jgi:hypothetical protein
MLVALKKFPSGRARAITATHKRQLETVVANLDSAAGQLERTLDSVGLLLPVDWGVLVHDSLAPDGWLCLRAWSSVLPGNRLTISLDDLPDLLRAIAKFMREGLHRNWTAALQFNTMTFSAFLPLFVEQLRKRTGGKPYFKEVAILIKAATGRPISAKHLKVIARRPRHRSK